MIMTALFFFSVIKSDYTNRLGYYAFPVSHLIIFQIAVAILILKNFSLDIFRIALAFIALSYAPSRFLEKWALGTFLTSGSWCGFCSHPALLVAITTLSVFVGIICPMLFLSSVAWIRLVSTTLWVCSEILVLDLGLGNVPSVFSYSLLLPLFWIIYGKGESENQESSEEILSSKSCNTPLIQKVLLARISQTTPSRAGQESVKYESAQTLSGDGVLKHSEVDKVEQIRSLPAIDTRSRNEFEKCGLGLLVLLSMFNGIFPSGNALNSFNPLPSFSRIDENFQCLAKVFNQNDDQMHTSLKAVKTFQDYGVYAKCQPFSFLSRLKTICNHNEQNTSLRLEINVSRNGSNFCREFAEEIPCYNIESLVEKRLHVDDNMCITSPEAIPRRNPLLRYSVATSWTRS